MGFAAVRLFAQAALFVFPLLVAAFVTPDEFGRFSLSLMILYMFTAIGIQSAQKPHIVQASKEFLETGRVSRSSSARIIITTVVFAIVLTLALLFRDNLLHFTGLAPEHYPYIVGAFFFVSFRYIYTSLFVCTERKMLAPLFELLIGVCLFASFLAFYLAGEFTLGAAVLTLLIGHCAAAVLMLPALPWRLFLPFTIDKAALKEQFRNSLWYVLGSVAVYLINWGDNIVLRLYTDFEQIGYYNFGYQIFKGMLICFTTITLFYLPNIQSFLADKTKLKHFMSTTRLHILGLGSIGLVVVASGLAPALWLVFGEKYDPALPVMYCLLLASFFALYYMLQLTIVEGMARFGFVQLANFLAVAVNLGLDFLLIPEFGILGAAIATTVAYGVLALVFDYYVRKRLKLFQG